MKPAHIIRFEKLLAKGRGIYVVGTAFLVAVLISFIQFLSGTAMTWQSIAWYALLGAVIAQVDWLILARRYNHFNNPKDVNRPR